MYILSIGGGEILLILFIALMLFGANSIPDVAKTLGKVMREFNNATSEIKKEFSEATSDIKKDIRDVSDTVKKDVQNIKDDTDVFKDSTK
jgi:sec-independent protein translocase protein TatA